MDTSSPNLSSTIPLTPERKSRSPKRARRTPTKPTRDNSPSGAFIPDSFIGDFQHRGECNFIRGAFLGKGMTSRVYIYTVENCSTDPEQIKVAVKVVDYRNPLSRNSKLVLAEIKVHQTLDSPYIVKFHGMFIESSHIFIITELCVMNLQDIVRGPNAKQNRALYLNSNDIIRYTAQILEGLRYLREINIVHGDLKPGNVFLKPTDRDGVLDVKIGDFGLAAAENTKISTRGTPNYIAPEVLYPERGQVLTHKVDLWALGCMIFAMQKKNGSPPFETSSAQKTYGRIRAVDLVFPSIRNGEHYEWPDATVDLIKRILVKDPAHRISYEEMMQHPFFEGYVFGD